MLGNEIVLGSNNNNFAKPGPGEPVLISGAAAGRVCQVCGPGGLGRARSDRYPSHRAPARTVRRRGRYMQEAVPVGQGAMAAILGLDADGVMRACEEAAAEFVPTLIVGHWGDKLHEYRDARALAQQLPNAKLLSARHILELRTQPARLWPQIAGFLARVQEEFSPSPAPRKLPGAARRTTGRRGRKDD